MTRRRKALAVAADGRARHDGRCAGIGYPRYPLAGSVLPRARALRQTWPRVIGARRGILSLENCCAGNHLPGRFARAFRQRAFGKRSIERFRSIEDMMNRSAFGSLVAIGMMATAGTASAQDWHDWSKNMYLRLDTGASFSTEANRNFGTNDLGSSYTVGGGIGYRFDPHWRGDVTARLSRRTTASARRQFRRRTLGRRARRSRRAGRLGQRLLRHRNLCRIHALCRRRRRLFEQSLRSHARRSRPARVVAEFEYQHGFRLAGQRRRLLRRHAELGARFRLSLSRHGRGANRQRADRQRCRRCRGAGPARRSCRPTKSRSACATASDVEGGRALRARSPLSLG